MQDAKLLGADLSNAYLKNADLTNADLRNAKLYQTDFDKATLTGCYLDGCDLSSARNLSESQCADARLTGSAIPPSRVSERLRADHVLSTAGVIVALAFFVLVAYVVTVLRANQKQAAPLVEVVIHGGAVHASGLGDLGDGVQPLAIRPGGGVHAPDGGGPGGAQLGLAAPGAAAGPGGVQALAGALDDQLALELVDRAEDMEDQPPGRRGGVDLLLQDDQADAALAQLVGERQQVLQRPHRAGQPGDDEHVARAEIGERFVELGAGGVLAGSGVREDLGAPVAAPVIDLAGVLLAAGGHPRVPDLRHHAAPAHRYPAARSSRVAVMALTVAQTVMRAQLGYVVFPTLFPDAVTWRAPCCAETHGCVGVTVVSPTYAGRGGRRTPRAAPCSQEPDRHADQSGRPCSRGVVLTVRS